MRLERDKKIPYAQVANHVLNDKKLSWKAKGIYAYLFSKPETWDFSTHRIKDDAVDGREALLTGIKELEDQGYLFRVRQGNGRVKYIISHAEPQSEIPTQEPESENTTVGNSHSGVSRPVSNTEGPSNKDKKVKQNPARSAEEEKQIADVIEAFKDVNPSYNRLFGIPPQREAAWRLIQQHGLKRTFDMVAYLQHSNAERYAPTITTPSQLESKLGELKAWADKQRKTSSGKGKGIISAAGISA